MKYLGFIKEYNNIPESNYLNIYRDIQNNYDSEFKRKIINYLKNGNIALSWMGVFIDIEDNSFIAPQIYYTDGEWIWPSYLIYYLEKDSEFGLTESFVNYLEEKEFVYKEITKKELSKIENDFSKKLEKYW